MAVVRTQQVKKVYEMGDYKLEALKGIDLDVEQGEYLSIMGPSGSDRKSVV